MSFLKKFNLQILLISFVVIGMVYIYSVDIFKIRKVEIEIKTSIETGKVDQKSLNKIKEIIIENNKVADKESILELLEKQREHFTLLLTILATLLGFTGVFSFFKTLTEKKEHENLKQLTAESKAELIELKYKNIIWNITLTMTALDDNYNLVLESTSKKVEDLETFRLYVQGKLIKFYKETAEVGALDKLVKDQEFYNLLNSVQKYARNTFSEEESFFNIENHTFEKMLSVSTSFLNKKQFADLFENIKFSLDILGHVEPDFGVYKPKEKPVNTKEH